VIFRLHTPTGRLARIVPLMVYHEGYNPPHPVDRLLPDGSVNLIIDLTDAPKFIFDNSTLRPVQTCRRAWFSGTRTTPISISTGPASSMLVLSFHPAAADVVLGESMVHFTDVVVDADAIWGPSVDLFREHLLDLKDVSARFRLAEAWVADRIAGASMPDERVRNVVSLVARTPEQVSVQALAVATGYSRKHLVHLFREHVGVPPKQFQRICRFQRLTARLETAAEPDWARLALETGFSDQAHMIREFRLFSGFSPSEYMRAKGDALGYVPVPER